MMVGSEDLEGLLKKSLDLIRRVEEKHFLLDHHPSPPLHLDMSSSKATASGGSGVGPNRRKWDMDEYGEKARQRDREDKERAQENEERLRKGQKPLQRKRQELLPKATETLKAREGDLEIEKNQGKTLMVDGAVGGRKGPGFHCEVCNRTFKDSLAYLDHVNGRLRECVVYIDKGVMS
jgi:hypothetical protein